MNNELKTVLKSLKHTIPKITLEDNEEYETIDTYAFIMEGTPGQLNNADSAGDINLDPDQANSSDPGVIADAEADIETQILARISENDSAGGVHVTVRYLPADGVTSAGAEVVYGTLNARVSA